LRRNIRKATIWTAHTVTVNSLIESNKKTNKLVLGKRSLYNFASPLLRSLSSGVYYGFERRDFRDLGILALTASLIASVDLTLGWGGGRNSTPTPTPYRVGSLRNHRGPLTKEGSFGGILRKLISLR
jgi:hypothetical protein